MRNFKHNEDCDQDDSCECVLPKEPKGPLCICPTCDGEGKHSRGLEPAGGGFTQSEFAEAFGGWDDEHDCSEADNYFAGKYDEACDTCGGKGMIREDDEEAMGRCSFQINMARGYNEDGEPMH